MFIEHLPNAPTPSDLARAWSHRIGLAWLDGDGSEQGRWSFLGCEPAQEIVVEADDPGRWLDAVRTLDSDLLAPSATPEQVPFPRWIGYVAYDSGTEQAAVRFLRYDALVAWDLIKGRAYIVGESERACRGVTRMLKDRPTKVEAKVGPASVPPQEAHASRIRAALEHIARGDIYQVNLARRWTAQYEGDPLALALAMRKASPVPFGFFLRVYEEAVITRSMERFLSWSRDTRTLLTRPIKGTIARGGNDAAESTTLRSDEKELAEHSMIVDLMRNDLSRVAEVGTVHVPEQLVVEPYARLSHLVSTVACTTRTDATLADVLGATFPPGSVTGTPKIRAQQIIGALEPVSRGVYTGAVGYVDCFGNASFSVAIRTARVRGTECDYFAGGGIVAASDPAREVAETELKARAFLDALAELPRLRASNARVREQGPRVTAGQARD